MQKQADTENLAMLSSNMKKANDMPLMVICGKAYTSTGSAYICVASLCV